MKPSVKLSLFFSLVLLLNCTGTGSDPGNDQIAVKPIDNEELLQMTGNRNGKILLLNIWATWCVPCREEFEDLIKLADYYRDKQVEIIGISADYADEVESKIIPFLQSQNSNFTNFVQNFSDDSELINLLNAEWNGALPATFIYDREGRQRFALYGKHSFEEFKEKIEEANERN